MKITWLSFVLPLVAGFALTTPGFSSRRDTTPTALSYHDDAVQEDSPTLARAKDCIEHFGECSVEELQDLQSSKCAL